MTDSFVKSADTKVPVHRSRGELERILRRYGCTGFGTTSEYELGQVVVHFRVPNDGSPDAPQIPIRLEIDIHRVFKALKDGGYRVRDMDHAERVAWRQLVLWVDAACSVASAGLKPMAEAFFADVVIVGEDGRDRRMIDHAGFSDPSQWQRALTSGGGGAG